MAYFQNKLILIANFKNVKLFLKACLIFFSFSYLAMLKLDQIVLVAHLNLTSDLSFEGSRGLYISRDRYSSLHGYESGL